MSPGKCKLKQQQATTTCLLEGPESTLTTPNADEDVEQQECPLTVGAEAKLYTLEVCTIWQFLRNLNIVLPYNALIALLSIYSKELKIHVHTKTWHMDAYRSFTQNFQNLYATRTPFSRGMDTMVHKDNSILVSTKKK